MHLRSDYPVAAVPRLADGTRQRRKKAGPPGTALEFPLRHEQRLTAAGTGESAGTLLLQQRTRPRSLRVVLTQDGVLLRRQDAAPFVIGFLDRKGHKGGLRASGFGFSLRFSRAETGATPVPYPCATG